MTAHELFDLAIRIPKGHAPSRSVYALVKLSYSLGERPQLTAARPLQHDFEDESTSPRLHDGSDFFPYKDAVDVVVEGAEACSPDERPVAELGVALQVGAYRKRGRVIGLRVAARQGGRIVFTEPEPFTRLPLSWEGAYGGVDTAVTPEDPYDPTLEFRLLSDHPGLYPRNLFGRGYRIRLDEGTAVPLPWVESAEQRLGPETLEAGDPRHWHRMPLSWGLTWQPLMSFPRYLHAGAAPWFAVPFDHELAEVRLGLLPAGGLAESPAEGEDTALVDVQAGLAQAGPAGQVFRELPAGTPIALEGMHAAYPVQRFVVPPPPPCRWQLEGAWQEAQAQLHHLVLYPSAEQASLVYRVVGELPRALIPGLHQHIPVGLSVLGQPPIPFGS